ncbi:neurofilament light protein [Thalictrum thalictroides]|uniref:Neurofilament light protein n=1 Tax=Thalictrum thalictroides TaxID=46969 RepID=A0A7J6WZN8_THATH|nr:neurofilament light protein [Thalictrum thalictroides]
MASAIDEEMDSLFEGMVLFTPSQLPSDSSSSHNHQPPPLSPSPPPPPIPQLEQQQPSSTSTPLDENLFSDLILTTPIDTQTLELKPPLSSPSTNNKSKEESSSSSSITRQVSRKKKKAGIRIGYGRDTTSLPDEPSPAFSASLRNSQSLSTINDSYSYSSSQLNHDTDSTPKIASEINEKSDFEDAHIQIQLPLPAMDAQMSEINDFEDTQIESTASMPNIEIEILEKGKIDDVKEESDLVCDNGEVGHEHEVTTSGNSTEERLEQIRVQISEKLEGIRSFGASVSAMRKELARKRRKAAECVNSASFKYKELEKELEEACEAEDFEKAEKVSESLAAAEKEKESFMNELRDAEADCDSIELKMQEVLELQIAAEEEAVSILEQFAKEAADNANLVLKNAEAHSFEETAEWLSSVEALEVKKMELEIESHLINDARLGLNNSIEHVIADDRTEQVILCKRRDTLKEELEKLLLLVRQKEAEILENYSSIQVVEKRIADAVSGFHDVQSNIDTKYYDTQSVLSSMDSQSEALSKKKKEIDDLQSQEEKRGEELKELVNVSINEAKACQELVALRKSLAVPILKYREVKSRLAKTEANILEDVQILKQEVSAARASLQELSSARSNIQQEITSAKQRIFFIDKRSPELEAEKRVAAAARNFKEAGRIAAELKTLVVEMESIQTKMDADILQLGKIEEEINNTVKNLNDKEELILLREREAAKSGCERLRLVSATAMAERSATLELGDHEEANALLAEAEAADTEARQLQQACNLQDEEFENAAKHLISIELIAKLGRKQLAEIASSISSSAV